MPGRVGYVHIGDTRTDFILTFHDTIQDPTDPEKVLTPILTINDFQKAKITWTKPDGTQITRDETQGVALYTDGLDGKLHFLNDPSVIPDHSFPIDQGDEEWAIEGWIKLLDGSEKYTDKEYFLVRGEKQ